MRILGIFELLRVKQWYKNLVIFISIIFSFNLFNKELFLLTFLGFISLCCVSSSFYIINDIFDIKKDRHHPEKKYRLIASGKISVPVALIISFLLLDISIIISLNLSSLFLASVLGLYFLSLAYSLFFRNIAFLDIIIISINFVIRAVSSTFIIHYPVSAWVILSTFFISVFLVSGKRITELNLIGVDKYRKNFKKSDKKILEYLLVLAVSCVFIFFSIYSILVERAMLLLSLPVALYITFSFIRNIYNSPGLIRNPEKFIFKKDVLLSIFLWLLIIVGVFYLVYN